MLDLPAVRHRHAGHELQPAAGGGHQQRQGRRKDARHRQGQRGRGGLLRTRKRTTEGCPLGPMKDLLDT